MHHRKLALWTSAGAQRDRAPVTRREPPRPSHHHPEKLSNELYTSCYGRFTSSIEPGTWPANNYNMAALKGIPVMVLFGDFVGKSEVWSKRLSGCKDFAAAAKTAGVEVEVVELPSVGIHGNSHMLMQDKNSLQVADWLVGWLTAHVK